MIDICPVGFNYFCNFATKSDAVDITNLLILHILGTQLYSYWQPVWVAVMEA